MEKFLLLIREDLKKLEQMTEDEFGDDLSKMMKWIEEIGKSGNFIQGEPLLTTGKYVNKENILSDGPFIEAKEAISGYLIIKSENLEQAAAVAQSCPLLANGKIVIEVRPIMAVNNE